MCDPLSGNKFPTKLARVLDAGGVTEIVVMANANATAAVNVEPGDGCRAVVALVEAGVSIV